MKRRMALALVLAAMLAAPTAAQMSVGISVTVTPPALPVYAQPPVPGPDYVWTPGYWAWDDYAGDYFWIPGTWLLAPRPGLLWTPPWWGWQGGAYLFHPGYWGPHVGFYGGVPYGFGYTGTGFQGAYWSGPHLYYNRSVTNITNVHVTNVYNRTVIVNRVNAVSYNGGPGGIQARPSAIDAAALHDRHLAATPIQQQHFQAARAQPQMFAFANRGRPPVAASARPALLNGPGAVPARAVPPYHPAMGADWSDDRRQPPPSAPHGPAEPFAGTAQPARLWSGAGDVRRPPAVGGQLYASQYRAPPRPPIAQRNRPDLPPQAAPFRPDRIAQAHPPRPGGQAFRPAPPRPPAPYPPAPHPAPPPAHPHGGPPYQPGGRPPPAHGDDHRHG